MPGIPPTADIFDAPGISLCLNTEWASFIDARVGQLLNPKLWEGTDTEIERAVDQIEKFLSKLGDVGVCQLTPVGSTVMWPGVVAPDGWLICDGAAVSRATYADLFAAIGTIWGPGDGATTFNLPDMRYRSPMGVSYIPPILDVGQYAGEAEHTLSTGEMPEHDHAVTDPGHIHAVTDPGHVHPPLAPSTIFIGAHSGATASFPTGATTVRDNMATTGSATTGISVQNHTTGVSVDNAGGGAAHNNVHPVAGMFFIVFAGV